MKKIFVLLLIIIVLTGCNDSKPKEEQEKKYDLTITDVDGNSTQYTWDELQNKVKDNKTEFKKKYLGGTITFTDTIKYVDTTSEFRSGTYFCKTYGTHYYDKVLEYTFNTSWIKLYLYEDLDNIKINDYKRGDVITVTTNIPTIDREDEQFYFYFSSYDGENCHFGSTPTKITKVE